MTNWSELGFQTCAIRAGQVRTDEGEQSEPIFPTSSYVFKNAAQAADRFSHAEPGNIYSRFTNPTVRTFEQRLATLEGGDRCIATASGMSAILTVCLGLLKAGDHIIASQNIFGTTVSLFNKILAKFGIQTTFVNLVDIAAWQAAMRPETHLLFLETPSNPLGHVADIKALADLAHTNGCWLVVDNCLCTPALQRPIALGADLVVHSATKYLDGQGRCVGGAIVGPELLMKNEIYDILRTAGPTMSPFNAWIFLKGLETLSLRMRAHCDNALALARWLETQPTVEKIHYLGLPNHPQHALARQQQNGFGGIVSFEVRGGKTAAWRIIDATQMISITANLGDTKTTITHPATTTHGRLTPEERQIAGISDGLIRVSVGLENIEDIQADLACGLESIT